MAMDKERLRKEFERALSCLEFTPSLAFGRGASSVQLQGSMGAREERSYGRGMNWSPVFGIDFPEGNIFGLGSKPALRG